MRVTKIESSTTTSARLTLETYPLKSNLPTRWSDVRNDRIGDVVLPLYFEDARGTLLRQLLSEAGYADGNWRAFMARLRVRYHGVAAFPGTLIVGSGIRNIGRSSYTFAQAAFQGGQCVALCDSFAVAVGPDRRPRALDAETRGALERGLLLHTAAQKMNADPARPSAARLLPDPYPCRHEFATRYPDTDAMGHVNNLGVLRYYEDGRACTLLEPMNEFVIRLIEVDVTYLREAVYPRPLIVGSGISTIGERRFHLSQALFQDQHCVGVCDAVLTCSDGVNSSVPIDSALRSWLERKRLAT